MAEVKTLSRQQKTGGIIGVGLLAFALAYRFFPGVLHVEGIAPEVGVTDTSGSGSAPMGFARPAQAASVSLNSEALAGPPVSLASSDVIMAYRRAANAPVSEQLKAWLRHGDQAAAADKLATGDDSAVSWYAKVLDADKDNRAAQAGLAEVARKLASRAHTAMLNGDADQARTLLEQLQAVPLATTEAARAEQQFKVFSRVTPMLGKAADLLKGDSVSAAQREEALNLYRQVIALDPDNAVARQGMLKIQRVWLDRALAAVARNDYDGADHALAQAASVVPSSQELQNTRSRVEGMRRLQATNVLAQAHSALDSGDIALARKLADRAFAISPDLPGMQQFNDQYENARLYGGYKPGQVFSDRFVDRGGQAPQMVVLPTGQFQMGSPNNEEGRRDAESPRHRVDIDTGVAMGRTEVTVAEFRDFVSATGYKTDAERAGTSSVYDQKSGRMHEVRGADWRRDYAGNNADSNDPVVNVSWNDASAYTRWLSQRTGQTYRLPSEAEFEYALRAGTATPYWWGSGPPRRKVENLTGARDRAANGRKWIRAFAGYGDGFWGPAPVAHFDANPFGLHDMDGNVSEWVTDCWHDNYTRAPRDGSAWVNPGCSARVVRGGSWGSSPEQDRSAYRVAAPGGIRSGRVGFRVARDLTIRRKASP
ncbi:MAG: SUMF1/EgtB/PvdO family nonheme iron enzyme [Rhodanobacteraceae bacterium]